MNSNGNQPSVPILGQKPNKAAASVAALARELDVNGLIDMPQSHLPRQSYVSAVELVEMIRAVVREELQAAFNEAKE